MTSHEWGKWVCAVLLTSGALQVQAWTVTVNDAGDTSGTCASSGTGSCTLRDAIAYANTNRAIDSANRIEFVIGSNDQTIAIGSTDLPTLLAPQAPATSLTIDASTQPGYSANSPLRPLITLKKTSSAGTGLTVTNATTIKGLAIGNFNTGIAITGSDNVVLGCHVGTDAAGTAAMANATNIRITGGDNLIGGTTAADRNIISAATGSYGIEIFNAANNTIQGNYIGTDITGTAELGNTQEGIHISGTGDSNVIDRNLISANTVGSSNGAAIWLGSSSNTVTRNLIGSNATGDALLGVQSNGIYVAFGNASNNRIGTSVSDGNLIVGSTKFAITISGSSAANKATSNQIIGNTIGISADTSTILANNDGIWLTNTDDTTIRSNTIAGSLRFGIAITDDSSNTRIQGNFIGTNASAAILPNQYGIFFSDSAHNNMVGGQTPADANVISNHSQSGVHLNAATVDGTSILGNSIYHNRQGRGISRAAGANGGQEAPVLTALTATSIAGTLTSAANETYRIEYFSTPLLSNSDPDEGAGKTLLGTQNVTTNGAGLATLNYSGAIPAGNLATITATATRISTGNTSLYANSQTLSAQSGANGATPIPVNSPWLLLGTLAALAYVTRQRLQVRTKL